jgi:lysozyme family protein
MTTDDVIAAVIVREGGFSDRAADRGGPTKYGITARDARPLAAPRARRDGRGGRRAVDDRGRRHLSRLVCRAVSRARRRALRAQCVDFGVTSGVGTAAVALQRLLGVTADGVVGRVTAAAAAAAGPHLGRNAYLAARCRYLERVVDRDPTQLVNLHGWIRRAVVFFVEGHR